MKDDLLQLNGSGSHALIVRDPAAIAAAEAAKARIQAAYIMAMQRPRSEDQARARILNACKRPAFAERVEYAKPIGKGKVRGPSVRFAELALREWQNIDSDIYVVYEDRMSRRIKVRLLDCETNAAFGKEITIAKTVERRSKEGRVVVAERVNTYGETVYIVEATDDEIQNKENAMISKALRNEGLRLIPQDIVEEALHIARETLQKEDAQDPQAAKKKVLDSFSSINVFPAELEKYLGHKLDTISPSELMDLRSIYSTIREGDASWSDYIDIAASKAEAKLSELKSKLKAEAQETPQDKAKKFTEAMIGNSVTSPEAPGTEIEPGEVSQQASTEKAAPKAPGKARAKKEPEPQPAPGQIKPEVETQQIPDTLTDLNNRFKLILESDLLRCKAALLNAKLSPKLTEFGNEVDAGRFFTSYETLIKSAGK